MCSDNKARAYNGLLAPQNLSRAVRKGQLGKDILSGEQDIRFIFSWSSTSDSEQRSCQARHIGARCENKEWAFVLKIRSGIANKIQIQKSKRLLESKEHGVMHPSNWGGTFSYYPVFLVDEAACWGALIGARHNTANMNHSSRRRTESHFDVTAP